MESNYPITRLLIVGLVFHLVYIGTVFDCYFTSPVVHGMQTFNPGFSEAKRLVLIVADGLRADSVLSFNAFPSISNSTEPVAPYLRSIIEYRGAFGVSHTRVPTESRPGHVALIGGMYEDVSAVTKGWKTNPVDFDSVFNRSSHTFSFGSPDILPIFAHGATPGRIKTWSYKEEDEDFTKDAAALDLWVLDNLRTLFKNATADATLNAELRGHKVVFFLHLLGLDVTGHSYRPHSKEYMNNIKVVDAIVRQTEQLVSDFYGDSETSFVFTADHGMSKIGNHGDGDPDNTRTPLIAWGKGIRGPLTDSPHSSHDKYSEAWGFNHIYRRDVEQADIAALMASLIGIDWPVNSVGVLPDVDSSRPGYLEPAAGDETKARLAFVNAKTILEHYRIKHTLKQQHRLFYKPYSHFSEQDAPGTKDVSNIETLLTARKWTEVRQLSSQLIVSSLEGLRYLQTYDRGFIRAMVIAAYLGWAGYGAVAILIPSQSSSSAPWVTLVSLTVLVISWISFTIQRFPLSFYLYIVFPCYFWRQVLAKAATPLSTWVRSGGANYLGLAKIFGRAIIVGLTLLSMVAAYTHRNLWSIGFALMGVIWPVSQWPKPIREQYWPWTVLCLIAAIFPVLDVNKTESLSTIVLGGMAVLVLGGISVIFALSRVKGNRCALQTCFIIQLALIALSIIITASSVKNLQARNGLPLINQVSGWMTLVSASLLPFVYPIRHPSPSSKILMFILGFAVCFVILSISVEGLFYLSYSAVLVAWVEVEAVLRSDMEAESWKGRYRPRADDLRIALFFLFFMQVAFFGTGNVASISSFYLDPVYRLIPVFSPFSMAALLIFKIVAPFVILAVCFAHLNARLHLPPFSLLLIALTLTDGMTVTFFFQVTDTGSWLEIGQSISFFCITSLLLVWSVGLCVLGETLMADTLRPRKVKVQ